MLIFSNLSVCPSDPSLTFPLKFDRNLQSLHFVLGSTCVEHMGGFLTYPQITLGMTKNITRTCERHIYKDTGLDGEEGRQQQGTSKNNVHTLHFVYALRKIVLFLLQKVDGMSREH